MRVAKFEALGAQLVQRLGDLNADLPRLAEIGLETRGESDERVVSEAADVLYHLMVGLRWRAIPLRRVFAELARRVGTSGHEEKASRRPAP